MALVVSNSSNVASATPDFITTINNNPEKLVDLIRSKDFDAHGTWKGRSYFNFIITNLTYSLSAYDDDSDSECDCDNCRHSSKKKDIEKDFESDMDFCVLILRNLRAKTSVVPDDAFDALNNFRKTYRNVFDDGYIGNDWKRAKCRQAYRYIKFWLGKHWDEPERAPAHPSEVD